MERIRASPYEAGGHVTCCQHGAMMVEFALILPIFVIFLIGTVEFCNYAIAQKRLENTVSSITDVTAQLTPSSSAAELNAIFVSLPVLLAPSDANLGNFILTDVQGDANGHPKMMWQLSYQARSGYSSTIGTPCSIPNLAAIGNMSFNPGDEVIIGEGYMPYTTFFTPVTTALYKTAVFWPRNGQLGGSNFGGAVTLCP